MSYITTHNIWPLATIRGRPDDGNIGAEADCIYDCIFHFYDSQNISQTLS